MSAADLVAMGVEVMANDEEYACRPFCSLLSTIDDGTTLSGGPDTGVREVVRMLRDAASSAIVNHQTHSTCIDDVVRTRRFLAHIEAALQEIL